MESRIARNVAPDVSIALCTYNRAAFLAETLDSLIRQETHGIAYEIVVIDDGSTDATSAVVETACSASPVPIRYIRQLNSGVGQARNRAVAEAKAPWIAFIDDDELASEQWLYELFSAAKNSAADCVGGPALMKLTGHSEIEPVGTITMLLGENPTMKGCAVPLSLFDRLRFRATRVAIPGGGNALVRKGLIEELGGFEPAAYGEDLDFFRRAERRGARFAVAERACIYHLIPPERLQPSRLYALAKCAGTSQAALDQLHSGCGRQGVMTILRLFHACVITAPALILHVARRQRSHVVSRLCSLHFAAAYILNSLSGSPRQRGFVRKDCVRSDAA